MEKTLLQGVKVIELATVLAGPSVGMFLAELGAEVIKIENPETGGDMTRFWKLPDEKEGAVSAYYASVNWGKKTLWLNLKKKEDLDEFQKLLLKTDVLLTNFKPSTLEGLGLSETTISEIHPGLIHANLTGYSSDRAKPAFDLILQAETGFMGMNGTENGPPVKMPVALIDVLAAHQLKEAILCALLHREKTGQGGRINVSLFDAAVASLVNQASNYLMTGHIPQRMGSLHPNIAPYGEIFATVDGVSLTIAIGNEEQFAGLCRALDLESLPEEERFSSNQLRVKNREHLHEVLKAQFSLLSFPVLEKRLLSNRVPFSEINTLDKVFSKPEAQRLLLKEILETGQVLARPASAVFSFQPWIG